MIGAVVAGARRFRHGRHGGPRLRAGGGRPLLQRDCGVPGAGGGRHPRHGVRVRPVPHALRGPGPFARRYGAPSRRAACPPSGWRCSWPGWAAPSPARSRTPWVSAPPGPTCSWSCSWRCPSRCAPTSPSRCSGPSPASAARSSIDRILRSGLQLVAVHGRRRGRRLARPADDLLGRDVRRSGRALGAPGLRLPGPSPLGADRRDRPTSPAHDRASVAARVLGLHGVPRRGPGRRRSRSRRPTS